MATESPINTSTEPPMSPPETFHPWLRLPVELKLEVLACYVPTLTQIVPRSHKKYFQEELGVIVATRNRELVTLCLGIYYSKNAFAATCLRFRSHRFDRSPPSTYGHLIRSLNAKFYASWDPSITSYTDRPHFGLLFHDQTSTGTNSSLTWMDDFPNVKDLELTIGLSSITELRCVDACSSCGIAPTQFDGLRNWLETTGIMVKGQNVTVKVYLQWGDKWGDKCQCGKSIEILVMDMATRKLSI